MNKRLMVAVALMAAVNVQAQKSPVGIVSFQDTVKSVQFGAISSVAADGGRGLQLSSVSNASANTFNGLQLSSVSNITNGMDRGLQLSGLLNVSSAMMGGWQWGAVNFTDSLNGLQIGAFNVARKRPKGWQIGLVNLSYDSLGQKIGLVNVNPKTDIDLMMYGGSSTKANIAMRFRNRSTYNVVGVGTHFMGLDSKFSGAVFYRLGQYFHVSPKWSLSGDLGYYHVETFDRNSTDKPERLYSLQARINADYKITEKIGAFASGPYQCRLQNHGEDRCLCLCGMGTDTLLRPQRNLPRPSADRTRTDLPAAPQPAQFLETGLGREATVVHCQRFHHGPAREETLLAGCCRGDGH